jgi:hypothetical protein
VDPVDPEWHFLLKYGPGTPALPRAARAIGEMPWFAATFALATAWTPACHGEPAPIVGVSAPRAAAPERPTTVSDAGADETSPVPADFRRHMKSMAGPFLSRGHGDRFDAVLWANPTAESHWDRTDEMPDGAMLIEEAFVRDTGDPRPAGLFVMQRTAGTWRYWAIGTYGEVAGDERVDACAECHRQARSEVFSFSFVDASADEIKSSRPTP